MNIKALLALLLWTPPLALAQAWPTRQDTTVVPYPPGGLIDIVARVLAPALGQELGQPVLVENKPGAGVTVE